MVKHGPSLKGAEEKQSGINMVDLMMWLVIAALLLAAAIQGIGFYQKASYVHQMESDLSGAGANVMAMAANNKGVIDRAAADDGVAETKWSAEVAYSVEDSADGGMPYLRATHPGVNDLDAVYLFEECAPFKVGVNLISKSDTTLAENCGIVAPVEPTPTPTWPPADSNAAGVTIISPNSTANFADKTAYSMASGEVPFGLKIQEATTVEQEANFKVEFSGGENIGLASPLTTIKSTTNDRPWRVRVAPTAEGYKTGEGKITAKVTDLTSGAFSYKTFTLTVLDNPGPVLSPVYTSYWPDRTIAVGATVNPVFGFRIQSAKTTDYTVKYSGGSSVNATPHIVQAENYIGTTVDADWYVAIKPQTGGFTAGTATITATATHNATGHVFTKTWTLTVQ